MMNRSIQLTSSMIEDIVMEALEEQADVYKHIAEGTARGYVHPSDQEDAHVMYEALVKVLGLYR